LLPKAKSARNCKKSAESPKKIGIRFESFGDGIVGGKADGIPA
jgi:hypothetical protein